MTTATQPTPAEVNSLLKRFEKLSNRKIKELIKQGHGQDDEATCYIDGVWYEDWADTWACEQLGVTHDQLTLWAHEIGCGED